MIPNTTHPGNWQNSPAGTADDLPRRGMTLHNEPSGGIEWINTQGEEMITYYYRDGSFLRFDKFHTSRFSFKDHTSRTQGDQWEAILGNKQSHVDGSNDEVNIGDVLSKTGDIDKGTKQGEEYFKKLKKNHNDKRLQEVQRVRCHNSIDQAEGQIKNGEPAPCPTEEILVKTLITEEVSEWFQAQVADCANVPAVLAPSVDVFEDIMTGGWECFTCWGAGFSPSSQDGIWMPEPAKSKITANLINLTNTLADNEKEFGSSKHPEAGTKIEKIDKNVVKTIGSVFNSLESYRKDPKGKLVHYGYKCDPFGKRVYPQFRESPLIEQVHVDPVPGGQYHLNVCDKYTLSVGANGISMKTNGNLDTFGIQTNILSERTLISACSELVLNSERIDISGEIISIRPKRVERPIEDGQGNNVTPLPANDQELTTPEQQVLIEGNLNVGINAIIAGGLHVEGEVSLHHITAPCEYQITDTDFEGPTGKDTDEITKADLLGGEDIGVLVEGVVKTGPGAGGLVTGLVKSLCCPSCIEVHPHRHWFKNLPLKLIRDEIPLTVQVGDKVDDAMVAPHDAVRAVGGRNNFAIRSGAMKVENSEDELTVLKKFGD